MATDNVLRSVKNKNVSQLITAMKSWNMDTALPEGQFGRVVEITTNGLTVDNSLDLEFVVPFDDDTEANEAEIKFYNLTKTTIGRFKPNNPISITAGYKKDTGVIFSGVISSVKTKWSGQDKVTTVTAIDCQSLKERDVDSIAYGAGVKASYILRDLVGRLGLPVACFKTIRDHTYTDAVTVSGGLMSAIKQYAEVCGVSAYINKRKVYVRHLADGDNLRFAVEVDTGLIDSPEEFTEEVQNEDYTDTIEGVKFKMLLEHRITTASIISLKSRNISGTYRVREGQHVYNETDFYTEITAVNGDLPPTTKSVSTSSTSSASSYSSASSSPQKKKSRGGGGGTRYRMTR